MKLNEKTVTAAYIKKKSMWAYIYAALFIVVCIIMWRMLIAAPKIAKVPTPLRSSLEMNEYFFSHFYSNQKISKQYAKNLAATSVRVNGNYGLKNSSDTINWALYILKANGDTLKITLAQLKALPKTEVIFNFKCIEGWSQITHWGGVRFSDFAAKYFLQNETIKNYAGLQTPDSAYYVGIDMPSMLHPQTLFCYELNGKPLPLNQGYPLRLIIPVKYGIKHLKRIGSISFSNNKPKDYWYELGYDYYGGL